MKSNSNTNNFLVKTLKRFSGFSGFIRSYPKLSVAKSGFKSFYFIRGNVPLTETLIATLAIENKALLLHDDRHYEMIATVVKLRHERYHA